ncbi:MAG: alcohol dehydrogenase catalytic domain-containing protein [Microthrixaceae bacterium]
MRAAVVNQPGQPIEVAEVDLGAPDAGQVRVAVTACGICHSDLTLIDGTFPMMGPTVPGHEAAGVVTGVGTGVTHLREGDHVVLSPNPACGRCRACRRGRPGACEQTAALMTATFPDGSTKLSRDGDVIYRGLGLAAWAQEVIVSERGAVKVPGDVPLDVACVIGCAVQTGVGAALNTAAIRAGDSVLIIGAGGIGVSIAAGAAIAGATTIIVSDPSARRRELALGFGATDVIDPTDEGVIASVERLVPGGVDTSFEAVGSAGLIETAFAATCNGGETILVGAAPVTDTLTVHPIMMMFAEKGIRGSLLGSSLSVRDIPIIVELWRSGRLPLESMVTARRPLAEVNEAVASAAGGEGLRTVLLMD